MEADRVIVELIAQTDGFDAKVTQSGVKFQGAMKGIQTSATAAEGAVKRTSLSMLQASTAMHRGFADVGKFLNSSSSPFVIPVKQGPAVSSAMRLVSSGASIMGGVLGGIAATGALALASALAELILKGKGANAEIAEMVAKLKEHAQQADNARKAQDIFGTTIEGVTEALRKNREILDGLNDSSKTAARLAVEEALNQGILASAIRQKNIELLKTAEAQLLVTQAQAQTSGSLRDSGAQAEARVVAGRISSLRAAISQAEAAVGEAQSQLQEALSRRAVELAGEDEIQKIKRRYDGLVEATRVRLLAEKATTIEIAKQTKALRDQQRAAEEAARGAKRTDHSNDQSGRQVNEAQARAIVASIGGKVTSGFRTVQHNEDVGGVPNSFHTKGQALDIAKTAGMTLGKIVKAFEAQGVKLIEKLDEGDHFHIAFGKRGKAGPSDETLAKRAKALADTAERNEQAFQSEKANLENGVINARQTLMTSAEAIAQLELESIEVARAKYNDEQESLVTLGRRHREEADALIKINNERAALLGEIVQRREAERKFRILEATAQRSVDFQVGSKRVEEDFLKSQGVLATTARQRRDQEQRLLDLQFEMERIQLQAIIADAERLRIKQNLTDAEQEELERRNDQALVAAQQLGTLPARQANAQAGNEEANQSPLQSFFGDIPNTADELNESFEKLAAGGLASVVDGITEAIMGMRSWGDVGRAVLGQLVSGLIKMGIQQVLLATVGQSVAAATTGANVALGATTAAAWAPAAAAVSLATFGANLGPALTALVTANTVSSALAVPKGFRSGGYTGNGPIDGIAGAVHGQEYVFDAAATKRIGVSNLEAMRNGSIRPSNARAASPGGGGAGLSSEAIAQLGGIVRQAIEAMPPINLHPTVDPGAAFEAALNSRRGRAKLFEVMGDNQSSIGGAS